MRPGYCPFFQTDWTARLQARHFAASALRSGACAPWPMTLGQAPTPRAHHAFVPNVHPRHPAWSDHWDCGNTDPAAFQLRPVFPEAPPPHCPWFADHSLGDTTAPSKFPKAVRLRPPAPMPGDVPTWRRARPWLHRPNPKKQKRPASTTLKWPLPLPLRLKAVGRAMPPSASLASMH